MVTGTGVVEVNGRRWAIYLNLGPRKPFAFKLLESITPIRSWLERCLKVRKHVVGKLV